MAGRGRRASLPSGGPKTRRGRLNDEGGLVVRCFSQGGDEFQDYRFDSLTMAPALRDGLVAAFVRRTAPGAGLTSLHSVMKAYRALVRFDRYLAKLDRPPRSMSELKQEHFLGFHDERKKSVTIAADELAELRLLMVKADGVPDALAGQLATRLPGQPHRELGEGSNSYSKAEFGRIADAARTDLRAAARRIRKNRDLLARSRAGAIEVGNNLKLAQRLELLDWVDRVADVPRRPKKGGPTPRAWVQKVGGAAEIVSWLHLTQAEVAAGAVLLAVMTGENPDVILKAPAVHHRADGFTGQTGTAIVNLRKLRRGRRAHMTLALSEVPDWISIPEKPEDLSTRDELHTPFGLYNLLHELTERSRALVGGNRLLVGYCPVGGKGRGRGLRPLNSSTPVAKLGKAWGLRADVPDENGEPTLLPLQLLRLRLSYIELHQRPVAHTEQTAATTYLTRNRGNITEYRKVVAQTLAAEVDKARTRGTVATMRTKDIERARTDPETVAAEQGVRPETLKRMIAGELDTVMTSCVDNLNSPYTSAGEACTASFMQCLGCECARALPRHLPTQVLVHDKLAERRQQIDALRWAQRFALPHSQLADLLAQHDETAVEDARRSAAPTNHALVDRFLNRELDRR
ncbi:hypothetical protein ACIOGZ_27005 [Kitasatospora sp. NPDC088160]|uniref:hypothetical protein n=1 Tax=Kitasatospora sp. NPDC088160 TaxID=3364072 RepID=UPI003801201D